MTYSGDFGQQDPREQWPPQYQQPQQWEQGQQDGPWHPQAYDPGAHQQRIGGQQHTPQGPPPPPQLYPPQGQPWPQPGYQPPQGPPGWQQPGYGQQPPYPPPQPYFAPGPPQPPRRKRHTARNLLTAIGAFIVMIIAIVVIANRSHGSTPGSAGTATAVAACNALAAWENSSTDENLTQAASLRKTFQGTSQPLSGDFATWVSDIKSDPSLDGANQGKVASDCAAYGVTIFPSLPPLASPSASASNTPAPATKVEFIVSGTAPDGIDITYGPSGSNLSGPSTLDGTATMSVPFDGSADYYALNAQLQGGGSVTCKIVVTGPGDNPLTVSSGAASGGYNICSAQAAPEDSSGLTWTNEN
jgi:hypothetical protein